MKKMRVAIIGCGGIAVGKHMPALKQLDNVEMVAFCDVKEERAIKAAKEYGTPDAKVYTDYKELLKDESIDNVRICTPNRWHCEMTVAALNAGKDVMCEKPMAINYKEACEMVEASKKTGKVLTIGYQHRYDPDVVYAKKEAEKNTFGEMYFAKCNVMRRRGVPTWGVFTIKSEQGGGSVIDIGTHALDTLLYIMDNYKPKMVLGTTYDKLKNQTEPGNPFGPWDIETYDVEDCGFGYIVMENGATIILETATNLNTTDVAGVRYMICGTEAGVDNYGGKFKINGVTNDRQWITEPDFSQGGVTFYSGTLMTNAVMEQKVFLDATQGKAELPVDAEKTAVITHIIDGIYESARTGEPYYFNK